MVIEPPKTLSRIRTYAQDLENARAKSGEVIPVETKKFETPKLGTASTTVQAAPTVTPPPAPKSKEVLPVQEKPIVVKDKPDVTQIPAFHELQKKVAEQANVPKPVSVAATNLKAPTPKRTISIRAKKTDLKKPRHAGGGAIITDGRKADFNVFSALAASINTWFAGVGKAFKKKEAPKYTITDTERRKGVIQKAASKTGSIFTADSDTLRDEIRRRQTQHHEDPDITWSPNTEPGYALLESGTPKPITANVVVEFRKPSTPSTPVVVPPPAPRIVVPPPVFIEPSTPITPEVSAEIPPGALTPEKSWENITSSPEPEFPQENTVVETAPEVAASEPVLLETDNKPEEARADYELTTPEAHYKVRGLGDIGRLNTNTLSLGVIAVIASFLIIIIGARALFGIITDNPESISTEPAVAILKNIPATNIQIATVTPEGLEGAITEASLSPDTVSEFRLIDQSGLALSPSSALQLFGISANPLTTSVTEAHLVITPQGRALVLKIKDPSTTFGQLLASEQQLPSSLARVFTTSYTGGGTFYDTNLNGVDVRVNKTSDSDGLTYGFINTNTVVIAKDTAVFITVVSNQ